MAFLYARISVCTEGAPSTVIISGERQQMVPQVREWHHQRRRHHQQTQWQDQRRDQLSVGAASSQPVGYLGLIGVAPRAKGKNTLRE